MCRGVPTERTVAGLVKQLLEGLQYMHAHTIYHLDIRVSVSGAYVQGKCEWSICAG